MNLLKRYAVPVACAMTVLMMTACSSTKDERRVPTPLTEFKPVLNVQQVWKASVGKAGRYLFSPVAVGNFVYAAGANGSVAKIDAQTGKDVWRIKIGSDLSAGVGSDGTLTAVGALKGQVYVLDENGKQLWKNTAPGEIISPPLVGNGFVVVRTVDGQITAFNAQTGEQKWVYRNRAVPLNLRVSAGMTFAGGQAVLAGFPGGTFAAINVQTGDTFWETPVSYPKGVTEVERINDVTGPPTLVDANLCRDVPGAGWLFRRELGPSVVGKGVLEHERYCAGRIDGGRCRRLVGRQRVRRDERQAVVDQRQAEEPRTECAVPAGSRRGDGRLPGFRAFPLT